MAQRQTEPEHYAYLVARPHPWRRQLSLRDCTMTVGQLVATMRANQLSPEDVADDLDLPLAQIEEALTYYAIHHHLVDGELRQDKERLRVKGYVVGSPAVSR